jgi:hypothetical protein
MISGKSWNRKVNPALPSIAIGEVRVDRAGDYASLEAELRRLLPLLFAERGFAVVDGSAAYTACGYAIEREYLKGWRTIRSVSAEIVLYPSGESAPLPRASGRTHASGSRSIASSGDMEALFRGALSRLMRSLGDAK